MAMHRFRIKTAAVCWGRYLQNSLIATRSYDNPSYQNLAATRQRIPFLGMRDYIFRTDPITKAPTGVRHESSKARSLYKPLLEKKAVRFLNLLPGQPHDEISVELVYSNLASFPPLMYDAASYTWGDLTPTKAIRCDGQRFMLTQNAYDFLQHFRDPQESRLLWMDCICIDQSNLDERAEQVRMIRLIFRHAKSVLAWLGPESDDSAMAMSYIAQLVDTKVYLREFHLYCVTSIDEIFRWKSNLFDTLLESEDNKPLIKALHALMRRPWFRRVWVQQEAVMGKDLRVFCGRHEVSWNKLFCLAWLFIPNTGPSSPKWTGCDYSRTVMDSLKLIIAIQCYRSYMSIAADWQSGLYRLEFPTEHQQTIRTEDFTLDMGVDVPYLFRNASRAEATDPRDKVYAIYNVFASTKYQSTAPQIDYTKPWQVVFMDIAKWLHFRGWHTALYLAGRSLQGNAEIPSWVPDLRQETEDNYAQHSAWKAGGQPRSWGSIYSMHRVNENIAPIPHYSYVNEKGNQVRIANEVLELSAILQDHIFYCSTNVSPGFDLCRDGTLFEDKLHADLEHVAEYVPKYFTGEWGTDAFAQTMIANTAFYTQLATTEYARAGFNQWRVWVHNGCWDSGPPPSYHFDARNSSSIGNNRFCNTAHGLMCLVPKMTKVGDNVAILAGYDNPVVLRKVGDPMANSYELIGRCYIHGMMQGLASELIDSHEIRYCAGSEDEVLIGQSIDLYVNGSKENQPGEIPSFASNPKRDYSSILRILGERRIVLI